MKKESSRRNKGVEEKKKAKIAVAADQEGASIDRDIAELQKH